MAKKILFSDPQALPNAVIDWRAEGPFASNFDDIYATKGDAVKEKTHVFLNPNNLSQRMAELPADKYLSVLELGFGGGLNFLLTWQLWRQQRAQVRQPARLIYTSIEAFPMSLQDLQKCQQQWPDLAALATQLQSQYPLPIKGFHCLEFGDVCLHLILGSAEEALAQIQGRVDAVYLDGFNPVKNQAMWGKKVMQHIANLSHADTTIATYSAARLVKENLAQAGFEVTTQQGYGQKRNQLSGLFKPSLVDTKPAYLPPWQQAIKPLPAGAKIAVIGAGISGCYTALALQKRGYQVQLIDQGDQIAPAASGNQQGILYAKLPDSVTLTGQFHQQGLQYSLQRLHEDLAPQYWQANGLLQLAQSQNEAAQMQRVIARDFPPQWLNFIDAGQASKVAEQRLDQSGLFFPQAGWASPRDWCQALVDQLHLSPWLNTCLTDLKQVKTQWSLGLQGDHSRVEIFDGVVLCNANDAKLWLPDLDLPLKAIRGQVSYVASQYASSQEAPVRVVCGDGYVTPPMDGYMAIGASYNLTSSDRAETASDHEDNMQRLKQLLPDTKLTAKDISHGWVGFRATTPDYLPMIGQLANGEAMLANFAHLRKDKNYRFDKPMPWLAGLYINAGHGSKGLITAPLGAELLAAQISGEPLPLSQYVAAGLEPNRFFLRDMMRRKR